MFTKIYDAALKAATLDDLKEFNNTFLDFKDTKFPFMTVAEKLASEGHVKAAEFLRELGSNKNFIARGYAFAANEEQVELYINNPNIDIYEIIQGYILGSHLERAEKHINQLTNPNKLRIAYSCALTKNFFPEDKVSKTFTKETVTYILKAHALANNHTAVEYFRQELQANINDIALSYAQAGNHEKVELYRNQHQANVNAILLGYALAHNEEKIQFYLTNYQGNIHAVIHGYIILGWHQKVEELVNNNNADINTVILSYAVSGNTLKAEEYFHKYQANPNALVQGFILGKNYQKAEEYIQKYKIDVNILAFSYAFIDDKNKVDEYRTAYPATVDAIAQAYAITGQNSRLIDYYRNQYNANVNCILQGYVIAGDKEKVKEYKERYHAKEEKAFGFSLTDFFVFEPYKSFKQVQKAEAAPNNNPVIIKNEIPVKNPASANTEAPSNYFSFDLAIIKLSKHGKLGLQVIQAMKRLQEGETNYWNPYWMNSKNKLELIITAVNKLDNSAKLEDLIKENQSELYQALNFSRLTSVTFFGKFSLNKTKSLLTLEKIPVMAEELRPLISK